MVCFPNAKINLGLHITGKRPDGFHDIETIFYPIRLRESLEIIRDDSVDTILYSQSGEEITGNLADNLCIKAFQLIKSRYPKLPSIRMHLHKSLPMGAGLGGGSADAAFTLNLLNEIFQLHISESELLSMALELGSDCPFFLHNKPCLATGRGEVLTPVEISLDNYSIFIVNPGIHVNTGWAFSELTLKDKHPNLASLIKKPVTTWKEEMTNDFEQVIFEKHPEVGLIKNKLYECGALYASMSGSGSTVFGIYDRKMPLEDKFPSTYFQKWV